MKQEFLDYLESIGMGTLFRERAKAAYEFFKEICPDEITGIFVTEYVDKEGTRHYQNLWFFSEGYTMEAKLFATDDDFDITPMQGKIFYLRVRKQHYAIKKATEKSRLNCSVELVRGVSAQLKASKENCDHLWNILTRYLLPNLEQ